MNITSIPEFEKTINSHNEHLFKNWQRYKWKGICCNIYNWKNVKRGYYLVKWTSESYTLLYSKNPGNNIIKATELVCNELYFNPVEVF